eukprot:2467139-Prymnesium_polylepis.1
MWRRLERARGPHSVALTDSRPTVISSWPRNSRAPSSADATITRHSFRVSSAVDVMVTGCRERLDRAPVPGDDARRVAWLWTRRTINAAAPTECTARFSRAAGGGAARARNRVWLRPNSRQGWSTGRVGVCVTCLELQRLEAGRVGAPGDWHDCQRGRPACAR